MESLHTQPLDLFYRERERLESERRTQTRAMYAIYEQQWSRLATMNELRWDSFPWPTPAMPSTPAEITPAAIRGYILSSDFPESAPSRPIAERVEDYIHRWHPDHLDRGLLARVVEADREIVMEGVWAVAIGLKDVQREKQDGWPASGGGFGDIGARRREVEMRQRELGVHKMEEAAKREIEKARLLNEEAQVRLELVRVMEEEVRLKEEGIDRHEKETKKREAEKRRRDEDAMKRAEELDAQARSVESKRGRAGEDRFFPAPPRERPVYVQEQQRIFEEKRGEKRMRMEEERHAHKEENKRREEGRHHVDEERRIGEERERRKEEELRMEADRRRREEERRMEVERSRNLSIQQTLEVPREPDEKTRQYTSEIGSAIEHSSSEDSTFETTRSSTRPASSAKPTQKIPPPGPLATPPGPPSPSPVRSSAAATSTSTRLSEVEISAWAQRQSEFAERQREVFLREKEQLENARQVRLKRPHTPERAMVFIKHQRQWQVLSTMGELRWHAFPWPMLWAPSDPHEITLSEISAYIISPDGDKTQTTRDRVKEHLRRWHPDRFETKFLGKVVAEERETVKVGAAEVARSLNMILTQLNNLNLR